MEWINTVVKVLVASGVIPERFTGSVTFNFYMGGVSNVEKNESIKPPKAFVVRGAVVIRS